MSSLQGQTAFVTGGGTGIGRAIAIDFAGAGAKVIICGRRAGPLAETVQLITDAGGTASAVTCDLTEPDAIEQCAQALLSEHGAIDVLVNNAGFTHRNKPFLDVTEDEFDRVYDVNVKAIFHALQEALPIFLEQGAGSVINTSSTAALRPRPGLGVSCSSTCAVTHLTESLAI